MTQKNLVLNEPTEQEIKAQNKWVLAELKKGRKLSFLEALHEKEIARLAARIHDLRQNHLIETEMITVTNSSNVKKRFARYYIKRS